MELDFNHNAPNAPVVSGQGQPGAGGQAAQAPGAQAGGAAEAAGPTMAAARHGFQPGAAAGHSAGHQGDVLAKPGQKKSRLWLIILIIVIVVAGAGAGYLLYTRSQVSTYQSSAGLNGQTGVSEESEEPGGVVGTLESGGSAATTGSTATTGSAASETEATTGASTGAAVTTTSDSQRKTDLREIQTALEAYKVDKGSYPASASYSKIDQASSAVYQLLVPDYISVMPSDPKKASGWWYGYQSTDGAAYSLTARLEDETDSEGRIFPDTGRYLYELVNLSQ